MKKVFTTGQVAKICKVAPRTVSKWFDSGRLKGYRIPGSNDRRIPIENLVAFLKEYGMPTDELETEEAFRILTVALDNGLRQMMPATTEGSFHVSHADGQFSAGLEISAKKAAPNVIIVDTLLGNGQTREFLKALQGQEKLNETAVIVIAGEDVPQDEVFDGASYVLHRPFAPEKLNEQIRLYVPEAA